MNIRARQLEIFAAVALTFCATNIAISETAYGDFSKFASKQIYRGKPHMPDFRGRDKYYRSMRTRITNGIKGGVNFAGKYVIIDVGCGMGCHNPFMANVATGRIQPFPLGGEDNMYLSMKYKANSTLLIAQWQGNNEECWRESIVWTGLAFKRFGPRKVDAGSFCEAPL